ncbi:hypothetical protein L208DRAFT_1423690 [Tricholoma matsutake]|nr:hypothetical protein L208DRAFT_1423690 [Tricholoma matsutake 945]
MEEALLGVVIKYSAVTADGGPNVQSAKIKLNAMYLWILNIYDPCHNLNLFMKDVRKLFKDIRVTEGIKSNLEMHFSSSYYQVVSVSSCMNAIQKCLESRTFKFDTAVTKKLIPYIEDSVTHYGFMVQMASFIHLLAATTNSLLTLEGQNTNCMDLEQVLVNPSIGVSHY